jgi:hypothetical protein
LVLLELVTDPPPDGDEIGRIARILNSSRPRIEAAMQALGDAGLAVRDGEIVRASTAALRLDALWLAQP